jgi:hydroxypyruvate isomerase
MLFREIAMLDRFQAACAAGLDGVEMSFHYAELLDELRRSGHRYTDSFD